MLENCYIEFFDERYYRMFFKEIIAYHTIMISEDKQNEFVVIKIPVNLN